MAKLTTSNIKIIIHCLRESDFCNHATKIMTPKQDQSSDMKHLYRDLNAVFESLGKDFDIIANLAGLKKVLATKKGKKITTKINSLQKLQTLEKKTLREKTLKKISSMLSEIKLAET